MSKLEQLRQELNSARERLIAKGCKWDPNTGNPMDIKPFEVAYQEAIEKVFPDYIWWELTNYWDIFDAMMGGINDKDIIEEIINHIDPTVLDENFEENEMGAKIESGHTMEEYRERFGELYDEGELWDFSEEDFKGGAIEINPDIVYWKIEVDGSPRYFETCEECTEGELEKEDDKAVAKLTEGTSNFPVNSDFDLLVFYTYDEFEDVIHYNPDYPNEEDYTQDLGGGDFHVDYEAYEKACQEFEEKMWDENEVCVLTEDDLERLEDRLDEFNSETQNIANERDDYDFEDNDERTYDDLASLGDIELEIEPGYYEAEYIDVENEDAIKSMGESFGAKQRERIAKFLEELRKEFGLTKLGVAWGPASNGETGFKIIKEEKKEPKNKGSKKARFVGNPETEKTFFNVANGTCTSCALSEATKSTNWNKVFDDFLDVMEFNLVKYKGEGRKSKSSWDEKEFEGDWGLVDRQGGNLGDIESNRFDNARDIIDRLDVYIEDYFFDDLEEREYSEEVVAEAKECYSATDWLEFFKKHPEEISGKDYDVSFDLQVLDLIANHADDVDLEKCHFEIVYESLKEDKETQKQAAFENACDCLYYGYGKNKWNSCGLSKEDADEVWKKAFDKMSRDESLKEGKNPKSMSKEELEAEHKRLKGEIAKIKAKNPNSNQIKDLQARLNKVAKYHARFGKLESLEEGKVDSVDWFESVKCYGAPGDKPSEIYQPGQGAYCLVDEDCFLVDSITKREREAILDQLIDGDSQFSIPGTDVEYEIEFAGDCDWDEAYPYILKMFKRGQLNGVFKLNKKQVEESLEEGKVDSIDYFKSVKCWEEPDYEPGIGAYCLVDEDGFLVNSLSDKDRKFILGKLIDGQSYFHFPGTDIDYEIEFAGDLNTWDEAWPYVLRMFKKGKLKGVFELDKKQECKEGAKTVSSKVLKAHRK